MMSCSNNFWDFFLKNGIGMLFSIAASLIVAIITTFFLEKAFFKQRRIGASMAEYGIDKVRHKSGKMSRLSVRQLFGESFWNRPNEIKLLFLSGVDFFCDYKKKLEKLVLSGISIKVLLGNPKNSTFFNKFYDTKNKKCYGINELKKLSKNNMYKMVDYYNSLFNEKKTPCSYLERQAIMLLNGKIIQESIGNPYDVILKIFRKKGGDLIYEVLYVAALVQTINDKAQKVGSTGRIEIHYYDDEYRFPMILASYTGEKKRLFRKNKEYCYQRMWTNFNAPCVQTQKSINVCCRAFDDDQKNFIYDMENSFDFIYDRYTAII